MSGMLIPFSREADSIIVSGNNPFLSPPSSAHNTPDNTPPASPNRSHNKPYKNYFDYFKNLNNALEKYQIYLNQNSSAQSYNQIKQEVNDALFFLGTKTPAFKTKIEVKEKNSEKDKELKTDAANMKKNIKEKILNIIKLSKSHSLDCESFETATSETLLPKGAIFPMEF